MQNAQESFSVTPNDIEQLSQKLKEKIAATSNGFHLTQIPKGQLGEFSKIQEEVLELEDALQQDCKIMALVELSDLCGAIKHFVTNHFPGFTLDDLLKMNQLTERAIEIRREAKAQLSS